MPSNRRVHLPRAAYAIDCICRLSLKKKKIFITGDLESITTSKRENNDEIRRILAYVYLVELKAVSFSAFSTFFWYVIKRGPDRANFFFGRGLDT